MLLSLKTVSENLPSTFLYTEFRVRFFSNVSGEISAEKTIALFKFIGIFIRHIMNCTDALLFNLKVHDRFIDLKINCDSKNEMKIPDDLLDDITKLGGNVTTEYDADTSVCVCSYAKRR